VVPHLRAGVGAVATQAQANPYIGVFGVELLAEGRSAPQVHDAIVGWDPDIESRQFAIVDAAGNAAAHTGPKCQAYAGHYVGDGFAVAGNLLAGPPVVAAMVESFLARPDDALADRLLAVLEAGERAGGDRRGKQSAALQVVDQEAWPYVDLRVDDHVEPVVELRRLYGVWREAIVPWLPSRPTRQGLADRTGRPRPDGTPRSA
jgi:uncharacterized Ntn-hydrolase superfamily protein